MSIKLIGGTTGTIADVDTPTKGLQVNMPLVSTNAGYVKVANADGDSFGIGDDARVRISPDHMQFFDPIQGTSVNTNVWTQSNLTMTQTQTSNNLTLNAGLNLGANTYSILSSVKYIEQYVEYPTYLRCRAKLIPQTNAVIEFGLGNAATNAVPTDGVFFRINSAGQLVGVQNYGGVETLTPVSGASLSPTAFYVFEIRLFGNSIRYTIDQAQTTGTGAPETSVWDQRIGAATANGAITGNTRLPVFFRVYNGATPPSVAAQIVVGSVNVQQMDVSTEKPWQHTMASMGRHSAQQPVTPFSQACGWAYNANVATITPNYTCVTANATTIAAGSNGAVLPQSTINVASTTGFPTAGSLLVTLTNGSQQIITYTGTSGTTFTGCVGGVGTLATGNAVAGVLPYTTLGGQFAFNAPVSSGGGVTQGPNDLCIFAFQVPFGFQFHITDVTISAVNIGAAVATTATVLQWALAKNSSGLSLATADGAGTWQPRRLPLGCTSWIVGAGIGASAPDLAHSYVTPLMCESNRFIHVLVKPLVGTATANQVIAGSVALIGYWE